MLRKTKKGWTITNTPGLSKTKKAAKQRLRALEYNKGKDAKSVRRK